MIHTFFYYLFAVAIIYFAVALLIFVLMSIGALVTPDQKFGRKGGIEFAFLFGLGWGVFVLIVIGNMVDDIKAKRKRKQQS